MRNIACIILALILICAPLVAIDLSSIDREGLDHYLDGLIPTLMERYSIAGSSIALVRDGSILTQRAYGYADIDSKELVEASSTLFRIGSISKVFTWIAILQLHEKGVLDLAEDINTYLDFKIKNPYTTPITLAHLATHTAGFEDRTYGLLVFDPLRLAGLGAWLRDHVPQVVREPGTLASYSNFGAALAGYIIEKVSGESYEEYVSRHILEPLEMENTTVSQPPTQSLSRGYTFSGGAFIPQDFEYLQIPPAGAMSSTVGDMTILMLDLLAKESRILSDTSRQLLLSTQHRNESLLDNGLTFGLFETHENAMNIVSHAGDTMFFHSQLAILPDQAMGLFITCNSEPGSKLGGEVLSSLLDTFAPEDVVLASVPIQVDPSGGYRSSRRSFSSPEKFFSVFTELKVKMTGEDRILLYGSSGPEVFIHQGQGIFRRIYDGTAIRFGDDSKLSFDQAPMLLFEPVAWYESSEILLLSLAYLLIVMLCWIIYRLRTRRLLGGQSMTLRLSTYNGDLFFILTVSMLAALALTLLNFTAIMTGASWIKVVFSILPLLNTLSAFILFISSMFDLVRRKGFLAKMRSTSLVIAALIVIGQLYQWKFLPGRL